MVPETKGHNCLAVERISERLDAGKTSFKTMGAGNRLLFQTRLPTESWCLELDWTCFISVVPKSIIMTNENKRIERKSESNDHHPVVDEKEIPFF